MAYTIVKSDGSVLTSIADGTINTTSTSVGLPGRNFAGYGQTLDTNFVHQLENFAKTIPPAFPLRGQLWFDTNANTLNVAAVDGANSTQWLALTSTSSGGATTFGAVTVTGNVLANNITSNNFITGHDGVFTNISVSANANIATANVTSGIIGTVNTTSITTGGTGVAGAITGTWTMNGAVSGNALIVNGGIVFANVGIRVNPANLCDLSGAPISFAGTYGDSNVATFLPNYHGALNPSSVTTSSILGGGTIGGIWTLSVGARMQASYADLAERFEADAEYDAGTVVELGGEKEVTSVVSDLSENVFGVVSETAAYLMNSAAGTDKTHPAIAMSGRVRVKVAGRIKKGDRLVSAGLGKARAAQLGEATAFNTIGRSLVNKIDDGAGTVEAIVTIK
jgi:hypothetical protein